jgi:hypothetical protein
MSRLGVWLLLLLLLGVFGAAAFVVLRERAESGRDMPAYSVYSEADDGLGLAARVLRKDGWTPVALTRPVRPGTHPGLLVVAGPAEGGLTEGDARRLLGWVEEGNVLLLLTDRNTALHRLLGVTVSEGPGGEGFSAVDLEGDDEYTEQVDHLSVTTEATLSVPRGATPLWWIRRVRQPGALLLKRGKGRVLLVADPGLLTRRGLVRADGEPRDDNVMVLVNAARQHAREGKVFFDEYHHGLRSATGFWGYLAYHGQRWTLLPIALVVAVALWRGAVRLGPAVPTLPPVRADAIDYAAGLARLYQRAGARRLLARTLVRDFLGALTRHLHLRRTALPALILAAWRQQDVGPSAQRLGELMRGVSELRKGEVSDRQLLHWARAFDQFTRDMQG